jgi:hypothetical protein
VIAQAMAVNSKAFGAELRPLHLFDSFSGLPAATAKIDQVSPHVASGLWGEGRCRGVNQQELMASCAKFLPREKIHIYTGWFKDTLEKLPSSVRFAFLHIDSDLYQSAFDVLDHCFSKKRFEEGAMLFFDDWNCNKSSPELGERKAWAEMVLKYAVVFSDVGEYGVFGRKFVVHSYKDL